MTRSPSEGTPAASVEGTTPPSLRELAERATPGPWTAGRADMQSFFASTGEPFTNVYAANPDPDGPVHMGERLPFVVAHVLDESERNKDDAAYIAAANPAAILALYAEIDAKDAWHESELAGCRMERLASDAVIAELRSVLREAQEAVTLLDRVEISDGHDTFDGTISGGAPCDVDLFSPGPKYTEWENAVRANRAKRRAAAGSMTP